MPIGVTPRNYNLLSTVKFNHMSSHTKSVTKKNHDRIVKQNLKNFKEDKIMMDQDNIGYKNPEKDSDRSKKNKLKLKPKTF